MRKSKLAARFALCLFVAGCARAPTVAGPPLDPAALYAQAQHREPPRRAMLHEGSTFAEDWLQRSRAAVHPARYGWGHAAPRSQRAKSRIAYPIVMEAYPSPGTVVAGRYRIESILGDSVGESAMATINTLLATVLAVGVSAT